MKLHILRGSKQEIAESLVRMSGEVREAIVFEEESAKEPPQLRMATLRISLLKWVRSWLKSRMWTTPVKEFTRGWQANDSSRHEPADSVDAIA